jgi:hypothetical protein
MTPLTGQRVLDILIEAGWPPERLKEAFITAFLESSFNPNQVEDFVKDPETGKGEPTFGLFSLTPRSWDRKGLSVKTLSEFFGKDYIESKSILDPVQNARYAFEEIFSQPYPPFSYNGRKADWSKLEEQKGERNSMMDWRAYEDYSVIRHYGPSAFTEGDDLYREGDDKGGDGAYYQGVQVNIEYALNEWEKTKGPQLVEKWGRDYVADEFTTGTGMLEKFKTPQGRGYKFATPSATLDNTLKQEEWIKSDFDKYMAENPEPRAPQSNTDPRQTQEFQPNFMTPNTVQ